MRRRSNGLIYLSICCISIIAACSKQPPPSSEISFYCMDQHGNSVPNVGVTVENTTKTSTETGVCVFDVSVDSREKAIPIKVDDPDGYTFLGPTKVFAPPGENIKYSLDFYRGYSLEVKTTIQYRDGDDRLKTPEDLENVKVTLQGHESVTTNDYGEAIFNITAKDGERLRVIAKANLTDVVLNRSRYEKHIDFSIDSFAYYLPFKFSQKRGEAPPPPPDEITLIIEAIPSIRFTIEGFPNAQEEKTTHTITITRNSQPTIKVIPVSSRFRKRQPVLIGYPFLDRMIGTTQKVIVDFQLGKWRQVTD